jgi:hypothetical protein
VVLFVVVWCGVWCVWLWCNRRFIFVVFLFQYYQVPVDSIPT